MKKFVAHSFHDPKSSAGFTHETNDCSVRAMVNAFGLPYAYAHATMAAAGRKEKKGMLNRYIHNVVTGTHEGKFGKQLATVGRKEGQRQVTIATFCKYHPYGSYYCIVRGHAFAVVDGVVQDSGRNKSGKLIHTVYEIVNSNNK